MDLDAGARLAAPIGERDGGVEQLAEEGRVGGGITGRRHEAGTDEQLHPGGEVGEAKQIDDVFDKLRSRARTGPSLD